MTEEQQYLNSLFRKSLAHFSEPNIGFSGPLTEIELAVIFGHRDSGEISPGDRIDLVKKFGLFCHLVDEINSVILKKDQAAAIAQPHGERTKVGPSFIAFRNERVNEDAGPASFRPLLPTRKLQSVTRPGRRKKLSNE